MAKTTKPFYDSRREQENNGVNEDQDQVLVQKRITSAWSIRWTIKDFQRLIDLYPRGRFLMSNNFVLEDETNKGIGYDCRIRLFPNGNWQQQPSGFVALYFQAVPRLGKETPQGIFQAHKILKMEILRSNSHPINSALLTIDNVEKYNQNSYGLAKFCRTDSVISCSQYNTSPIEVTVKITLLDSPINEMTSFEPFLYNDRFCDVEFRFECGKRLKAHRVILASRSKYFEKLFDGNKPLIAEEYKPKIREDKRKTRKLRCMLTKLLNNLIWDNVENTTDRIVEIANQSKDENDGHTLRTVIYVLFDHACQCRKYSNLYAHLCRSLMDRIDQRIIDKNARMPDGSIAQGRNLFLKYFYTKCQMEFEKGCTADMYVKRDENGEPINTESNEYLMAIRERKRWLGLARFFAELFKRNVVTESIMHKCAKHCLSKAQNPYPDHIELLYELFISGAGKYMDHGKAKSHMDTYFERIVFFAQHPHLSKNLRRMLMDLINMRENGWTPINEKDELDRVYEIDKITADDPCDQSPNQDVNVVHIEDVEYKTFKRILHYFYTGKFDAKLDVEVLKGYM